MKALIEIKYCEQCPHSETSRKWTDDSWDDARKVFCKELGEYVHPWLDWHEKSNIPEKCPLVGDAK